MYFRSAKTTRNMSSKLGKCHSRRSFLYTTIQDVRLRIERETRTSQARARARRLLRTVYRR